MCDFISVIRKAPTKAFPEGKLLYLTYHQLFHTTRGKETRRHEGTDNVRDLCGHGTIRYFYRLEKGEGIQEEYTDLSDPAKLPTELVEAIKAGKLAGMGSPTDPRQLLKVLPPELAKAQAELAKARAEWAKALAEWDKARAESAKALAEWDKAQAEWAKALAEWDKARAEWDKARAESAPELWRLFANPENRAETWR